MMRRVTIYYFALLREERGCAEETIQTRSATGAELYQELQEQHRFSLTAGQLRIAVNDEFCDWNVVLEENDRVVFIPPVAGGQE